MKRSKWHNTTKPPIAELFSKLGELLHESNKMILYDKMLKAKNMIEHVSGVKVDGDKTN